MRCAIPDWERWSNELTALSRAVATGWRPRLWARFGWELGILNGEGGKPKGMHRRTFERMTAEHDAFVGVSLAGMGQRLGLINRRLDRLRDDLNGEG